MNNAPFKIGDRVVVVKPFSWSLFKKGEIFTISDVIKCACGSYDVKLVEKISPSEQCGECGRSLRNTFSYKIFALVQPRHEDAAIDESILEQARDLIGVRETVAPVGEPVNN